jgi:hypothetical protein
MALILPCAQSIRKGTLSATEARSRHSERIKLWSQPQGDRLTGYLLVWAVS